MKCLRTQIMWSLAARAGKIIANGACRSVKMFMDVSGAYVALHWIRLTAATPHLLVSQSFIGYRRAWEPALCWGKCGLLKCQEKTRLWCPTVTSTVFCSCWSPRWRKWQSFDFPRQACYQQTLHSCINKWDYKHNHLYAKVTFSCRF